MVSEAPTSAPKFLDDRAALACVHCGLCLGSCPTYLETGNENDSPRGRIYLMRALQAGRLEFSEGPVRHIDLCLGCRACEAACPSGVKYGLLLESTREAIERRYRRPAQQRWLRRVVIERVFPYPRRLRWALRPGRWLRQLGWERWLPGSVRSSVELLPVELSRYRAPEVSRAAREPKKGTIGFIEGCVMSEMFGRTNAATIRLIQVAGYEVITPRHQQCCGALYAHTGNIERARACARANLEAFEGPALDAVVINAAGCGSTLKEYGHLLAGDRAWQERAQRFSGVVRDVTEWLCAAEIPFVARSFEGRVTYHDACHLAHAQGITQAPRQLLRRVVGDKFVEMAEADVCCGSAGTYNLTEPEMAARLQRRKVENLLRTGVETVVTSNPGCILQMQAGLRQAGAGHIRVVHIVDFLLEFL